MIKVKLKMNKSFQTSYNEAVRQSLLNSGVEYVAAAKINIGSIKHEVSFAKALKQHPIYGSDGIHTEGIHSGTKEGLVDSGAFIDSVDTAPKKGMFAFSSDGKSLYIGSNLEYAQELEDKYSEVEGKFGVLEGSLYEVAPYIRKSFFSVFKRML